MQGIFLPLFSSCIPVYEQNFSLSWHIIVLLVCNFFIRGRKDLLLPRANVFIHWLSYSSPF